MPAPSLEQIREELKQLKHCEEHAFVSKLLQDPVLSPEDSRIVVDQAAELVDRCREDKKSQTLLDAFLQEYGLSNQEGVALMCLAEALLRVPDKLTADRLIAEKVGYSEWLQHAGKSDSWLVNASTWGLVLTGKLVELDKELLRSQTTWFAKLSNKLSKPVIRLAVLQAMKLMGGQYVLGRSIDEGIKRGIKLADNPDTRFSFDMLGEGARTMQDADRYFQAYSEAFDHVGALNESQSVIQAHGVSVKLSALHPQYHFAHRETVMRDLLPRITSLCLKAKAHNIGLSIDAEEAARLELSLDIFQALCENPELSGWRGLGFVMQAYQKRSPALAKWLVEIARQNNRTIMVRLVKGAYWDAEIKLAQEQGFKDYPVFTRKVNTDVCYLHCAKILLENTNNIYPQFATHNAHTAIAVEALAKNIGTDQFEFQRLHGMGELLYKHIADGNEEKRSPLRVYAPIGQHRDLLPYLVRRLLENGANSSFVNRFLDPDFDSRSLVNDCYQEASQFDSFRHSKIPTPANIFINAGTSRKNSIGFDLDDEMDVDAIIEQCQRIKSEVLTGHSIVDGNAILSEAQQSINPTRLSSPAGSFHKVTSESLDRALESAHQYVSAWSLTPAKERAEVLERVADTLEQHAVELIGLINREAGRTIGDCVSEIREAVDFCRYYAQESRKHESLQSQGVFLCISPWNFPVAIFTGQIAAALACGNTVLAKPADPTPIIATRVTQLMHEAGVPTAALHLIIGDGPEIGNRLLTDTKLGGVAFTGSTAVAKIIESQIANRVGPKIPFIAETGGQNCMVVDSTALPEQVVDDVVASAFHSAGQRCSALRVLYLQEEIADNVISMLEGALDLVTVGSPDSIATDVGPIIDQTARERLKQHLDYITPKARRIFSAALHESTEDGCFFAPTVIEIDSIKELKSEVFGPVLHIVRYQMSELKAVINDIYGTGYGLTFGVHSRISAFADHLFNQTIAGNTYINRNIIGAVVGVNPFGGHGLSGTGPKAGGPNYLLRFLQAAEQGSTYKNDTIHDRFAGKRIVEMPGPTGEENLLSHIPVGSVLFVLNEQTPLKELVAACNLALALGNSVTFTVRNIANQAQLDAVLLNVPESLHSKIHLNEENVLARVTNKAHRAIMIHASHPELFEYRKRVANRDGAITPLVEYDESILISENLDWYASYLSSERTKTDNLVAKGGNTQLFNLDEVASA